jgi:hypothetical protein
MSPISAETLSARSACAGRPVSKAPLSNASSGSGATIDGALSE